MHKNMQQKNGGSERATLTSRDARAVSFTTMLEHQFPSQKYLLMQQCGPRMHDPHAKRGTLQMRVLGAFASVKQAGEFWKASPMFERRPVHILSIGVPHCLGALGPSTFYTSNGFPRTNDPEVQRCAQKALRVWERYQKETEKVAENVDFDVSGTFAVQRGFLKGEPKRRCEALLKDMLCDQQDLFDATGVHWDFGFGFSREQLEERRAARQKAQPSIASVGNDDDVKVEFKGSTSMPDALKRDRDSVMAAAAAIAAANTADTAPDAVAAVADVDDTTSTPSTASSSLASMAQLASAMDAAAAELESADDATEDDVDAATAEERKKEAAAESAWCELPSAHTVLGQTVFGMILVPDFELQDAQAAVLNNWCEEYFAVTEQKFQQRLLELRAKTHPEIDSSVDAYFLPDECLESWLRANPPPQGFDVHGQPTSTATTATTNVAAADAATATRVARMELDAWLHELTIVKNKALWQWLGSDHVPLRLEFACEWLREHPLPRFTEEPEPVVLPLPCFATEDVAGPSLLPMTMSKELYYMRLRIGKMYVWGNVESEPAKRSINADDPEFNELMRMPSDLTSQQQLERKI